MRLRTYFGVGALFAGDAAAQQWNGVEYDAISVWPKPRNVTVPTSASDALGPFAVDAKHVDLTIDASCDQDRITALALEAIGGSGQVTSFRSPVRTYAEEAYVVADNATCASRCLVDSDCGDSKQCYIRSDLRWSSTVACSPSSSAGLTAACGCCVSTLPLKTIPAVSIDCSGKQDQDVGNVKLAEEAYTLTITANEVSISAGGSKGAANAIATLAQTLRFDTDLQTMVADVVPMSIEDSPAFEWRGVMLDTSRHFVPVSQLMSIIDAMAAAKLNVFHWHIVDSPSFPMASAAYPELSLEGSWSRSNDTIYSQNDIAAVVAHGTTRFVQVVVEVDTPAHTLAVARSYPEMMAGSGCWEWMADSGFKVDVDSDDCMALDPTNPSAREMVQTLLTEVGESVGNNTAYIHIGGDEVKFVLSLLATVTATPC